MTRLQLFLEQSKTRQTTNLTHTRIPNKELNLPARSYIISESDTNEFLTKYYEHVFIHNQIEHLTERQIPTGQMVVDLDFRYAENTDRRQHNVEMINQFIYTYLGIFKQFYKITDKPFKIFIFEKPHVNQLPTMTKDGVHIMFSINIDFKIQLKVRELMIAECKTGLLNLPLINSWESVFDEGISKGTTNWTLIGSRKPNHEAYELSNVYNVNYDLNDLEPCVSEDSEFMINEQTIKLLSCRYSDITSFEIKDEFKDLNVVENNKKKANKSNDIMNKLEVVETLKSNKQLQLLSEYANLINVKYIDNYSDWIKIIWSLRSYTNEDEKYLYLLALDLTKRSKHFQNEDYFITKWNLYKSSEEITIGTFYYYAKCSNETEFYKLKHAENDNLILKCINDPNDADIANCFVAIYGDMFFFKSKQLFTFNGILWVKDETSLQRCITKDFRNIFIDYITKLYIESKTIDKISQPLEFSNMERRIKQVGVVKDILGNNYKSKQICEVCERDILKNSEDIKIELNPNIFCFKNKVFNLELNKFVDPYKYDYMTIHTGYNYVEPTKEETDSVNKLISEIFPIEDEKNLYLMLLSIGLSGYYIEKFIIANGSGGNGKGMLNDFFLNMIGNYGYTGNNAVLLNPLKDGPNTSISNMSYKRAIFYREPKENVNTKLNDSIIKELTGGGAISARGLYTSDDNTILNATHTLEANKVPKIEGEIGDGLLRRIIDIYFRARFTTNIDDVDHTKYIYLADSLKKENIWREQHRCALFHILIPYYIQWIKNNKNVDSFIPESITNRTLEYLKNSSEMLTWFDETYEIAPESELELIKVSDIFKNYSCSEIYNNFSKKEKRAFNLKEFTKQLTSNVFIRKFYKDVVKEKKYLQKYKTTMIRSVILNYKLRVVDDSNEECFLNK